MRVVLKENLVEALIGVLVVAVATIAATAHQYILLGG